MWEKGKVGPVWSVGTLDFVCPERKQKGPGTEGDSVV